MNTKKILCVMTIFNIIFLSSCKNKLNKTEQNTSCIKQTVSIPSRIYMVEPKNDIFTSELFADVCMIWASPPFGQRKIIEYEEILEICQMFASLEFIAQREQSTDLFEMPLGSYAITLHYTDNTEYNICFGIELYYNHYIYTAKQGQIEELCEKMREAFEK